MADSMMAIVITKASQRKGMDGLLFIMLNKSDSRIEKNMRLNFPNSFSFGQMLFSKIISPLATPTMRLNIIGIR